MPFVLIRRTSILVWSFFSFMLTAFSQNNIGIGTNDPNSKAMLDISSTNRGLLIPRMTTAQRNAIISPPAGLLVYATTTNQFFYSNGTSWVNLSVPNAITDADGNTGIFAEKNANEDQLRFQLGGTENMRLVKNTNGFTRLELTNVNHTNLGIGFNALGLLEAPAYDNTSIGYEAGFTLKTGAENTFYGHHAGWKTTTSYGNTFVGRKAGENNITGAQNVFVGKSAGQNANGIDNVLIGTQAGENIGTGSENTILGSYAGDNGTGSRNTFLGNRAKSNPTNLTNATAIGAYAQVACSNCMVLGPEGANKVNVGIGIINPSFTLDVNGSSRFSGNTKVEGILEANNKIGIGRVPTIYPLEIRGLGAGSELVKFFNTAGAEKWHFNLLANGSLNFVETNVADNRMVLGTGGEVGIGKVPLNSVDDSRLQVKQKGGQNGIGIVAADNNNHWDFWIGSGSNNLNMYYNGLLKGTFDNINGAYTQASDRRLKKDITTHAPVLDKINQLEAFNYHYIDNASYAPLSTGFMAQDVQKLFPDAVSKIEMKNGETMLGINYQYFTVAAIKGLQEQQEMIAKQEERIAKLEAMIKTITEKK